MAVAVVAAALALPAAGFAWQSFYVQQTEFQPDGIGLSAFNSGINFNQMGWQKYAWDPYQEVVQLTLCDAGYHCYPYTADSSGSAVDYRTISYGRAKCHANNLNPNPIWVNQCYTSN